MITVICNQKGGVGKTAISTGLAQHASGQGSVLVIDADPQGNASKILGLHVDKDTLTLNDVLYGARTTPGWDWSYTKNAVQKAGNWWPAGIDVLPAERALASRETDTEVGRESLLSKALSGHRYDQIFIDCPPSLGMLTINALVAADRALIVTEPHGESVDGVAQIIDTITAVRRHYNPDLTVAGILVNRWAENRTDKGRWKDTLDEVYTSLVLPAMVPERVAVSAARTARRPLPRLPETRGVHEALSEALIAVTRVGVQA